MLARAMWVLSVSAATLGGLQACGSDSGGAHPGPDASRGGKDGTGATSSGGKAGAGGASGAGGTGMLGCDTSACDQQLAPIQSALGGTLGGAGGGTGSGATTTPAPTTPAPTTAPGTTSTPANVQAYSKCVQAAGSDVQKLQQCAGLLQK